MQAWQARRDCEPRSAFHVAAINRFLAIWNSSSVKIPWSRNDARTCNSPGAGRGALGWAAGFGFVRPGFDGAATGAGSRTASPSPAGGASDE